MAAVAVAKDSAYPSALTCVSREKRLQKVSLNLLPQMVDFLMTGNNVGRQTNLDHKWKLARDILVGEGSFTSSQ